MKLKYQASKQMRNKIRKAVLQTFIGMSLLFVLFAIIQICNEMSKQ